MPRPAFLHFNMSLAGDKLTNLPTSLQSYILANLSGAPRRPINTTLESANALTAPLPADLLAVAKSSSALSAATADALGARAEVLNCNTAKPLHDWVTALGPAVKAVSLRDSRVAREENLGRFRYKGQEFFDGLCGDAIKTFNALSAEGVGVEVLDVAAVPFGMCSAKEELLKSLTGALEQSRKSLREIGLRVTPICAKAVGSTSLPALEVAELKLKEVEGSNEILTCEKGKSAEAFMEMLRALEGHADRSQKKTTLRELRLINVNEAPFVDGTEGFAGLFNAVKTLKLRVIHWDKHDDDSVAKFITLFPNLECLHWNGAVSTNRLRTIHSACATLEELHLRPAIRYTPTAATQLPADGDASTLDELFIACQGKLRTLAIEAKLTAEQLKVLGENSPGLEHIVMEIGRENVGALSLLLGSHCRRLRKLELSFTPDIEECLGEDGWQTFTGAVQSASDDLCEVSIEVEDERSPMEHAIEAMVRSMLDILEFLGERARKVSFQVPMATMQQRVMVDALCRIMRACIIHTKSLETLEACFILVDADCEFETEEEEKEMFAALLKEKKKLMEELPRLQRVYLGGVDELAEERLEEMDE